MNDVNPLINTLNMNININMNIACTDKSVEGGRTENERGSRRKKTCLVE